MLIECPSGLTFQARTWRIGDRRNLQDRNILRQGLLLRKMLECVDLGVENPGPYTFAPGKRVDWSKVSLTDIIDSLIDIRIANRPLLDYNENCENCGARIPLTIDLTELERTPMSEEGKKHLATGEPIYRDIPLNSEQDADGDYANTVGVKLRMLLGEDMPRIMKYHKEDPAIVPIMQLVLHIVEIELRDGTKLSDIRSIREFYEDQDWIFQEQLEEEINSFGGGVMTTVRMDCRRCNAEQEGMIPFGGEFFYPRKNSKFSSMATL